MVPSRVQLPELVRPVVQYAVVDTLIARYGDEATLGKRSTVSSMIETPIHRIRAANSPTSSREATQRRTTILVRSATSSLAKVSGT
jgi:hypothetical protein